MKKFWNNNVGLSNEVTSGRKAMKGRIAVGWIVGVAGGLLLALGLLLGIGMLTVANDGVSISVVSADDDRNVKGSVWIGLWESVDPNDGGLNIIRVNEDGNGGFVGVQYNTFSTICTLQGQACSYRA